MKNLTRNLAVSFGAFREQAKAEKAYIANFWLGLFSRIIYNVMFLVFINVLFQRIGKVAGYTMNDFIFLYLVAQIGFYVSNSLIYQVMIKVIETVRSGNFDLLLLKPVPHRTFLYVNGLQPFDLLFTLATTLPIVASQINWGEIHFTLGSLFLGIIVWLCGLVICNTLLFALTLPVFKTGDATDTLSIFFSITSITTMPYDKLPVVMKGLSLFVLPHIIITAASTQVILQKGDTMSVVVSVLAATAVSMGLYQLMWRYALRNYTSASS